MPDHPFAILRTKLFRPAPAKDAVGRPRLVRLLGRGLDLPLTLVCAPGGYGKTTLVSQWIEEIDGGTPCGWYTAGESDNDPVRFVHHLVEAVRTVFPGACRETLALTAQDVLPEMVEVAHCLSNELLELEGKLILVIDDLHCIRDRGAAALLGGILEHPPPNVHLVVVSRRNPALPLVRLRATGRINELRLDELCFSREEGRAFLEDHFDSKLPEELFAGMWAKTEGWAVALRSMVTIFRGVPVEELDRHLPGLPDHARDFLVGDVVERLEPAWQEAFLKVSLLERLCPELCEAACPGIDGVAFCAHLVEADLFVAPLDRDGRWIRFHRLVREHLELVLRKRFTRDETRAVHQRFGEWFRGQGLVDEALEHLLKADDEAGTLQMVEDYCLEFGFGLSRKQVARFPEFPRRLVSQSAILATDEAWGHYQAHRIDECGELVGRIEQLLEEGALDQAVVRRIRGEASLLRCVMASMERDHTAARQHAERALELSPLDAFNSRSFGFSVLADVHRKMGDAAEALRVLEKSRSEFLEQPRGFGVLFSAECHHDLMDGSSVTLEQKARHLVRYCDEHQLGELGVTARQLASMACYQLNRLEEAGEWGRERPGDASEGERRAYCWARCQEAMIRQAAGSPVQALELLDETMRQMHERPSRNLVDCLLGRRALLLLAGGSLSKAAAWAERYHPDRWTVDYHNLNPATSCARILIEMDSPSSRERAALILEAVLEDARRADYQNVQIEILAHQALWHLAGDEVEEGVALLGRAIQMAMPGGSLRFIADLGEQIVPLLQKLSLNEEGIAFVGSIMRVIRGGGNGGDRSGEAGSVLVSGGSQPLVEALTKRELEILARLAARHSNKEIAEALFISVATVKRHAQNLYGKLAVGGRKDAVAKARGLGILVE